MLAEDKQGYWWRTAKGKWMPISEMNTTHLIRAIQRIEKKGKKFTRHYYVLEEEAQRRGLLSENYRPMLPFSVC